MLLIYVAIALFFIIIIWLSLQPKQGTKASNAPEPNDPTYQLPKPQDVPTPNVVPSPDRPMGDPEVQDHLKTLIQQERTIEALKLVRAKTGWGLKRSKDYLSTLDAGPSKFRSIEDPEVQDQLRMLMQQDQKIKALKLIRSTTGWGLKRSKDYFETVIAIEPLLSNNSVLSDRSEGSVESFDIDRHDINDRIRLLMQQHQKINAIKLVRTVTNWSLKESKDYIDQYPHISSLPIAESGPVSAEIQRLLSENKYMDAIHLVQGRTGMMLEEAKNYLEQDFGCKFPF